MCPECKREEQEVLGLTIFSESILQGQKNFYQTLLNIVLVSLTFNDWATLKVSDTSQQQQTEDQCFNT